MSRKWRKPFVEAGSRQGQINVLVVVITHREEHLGPVHRLPQRFPVKAAAFQTGRHGPVRHPAAREQRANLARQA